MKGQQSRALGEVAQFINGRAFKPSDWSPEGLPIIRIQNLTDPSSPANRFKGDFDKRYAIRDGDLLVSWSATLDVFIWDRGDAILNQHIFHVIPDGSIIRKQYLFYALKSVMDELRSKTHGSTMKHITKGPFERTTILVPPLKEQDRIVNVLNEAVALQTIRAEASRRTNDLVPALHHQSFDDPASKKWARHRFGDKSILQVIDGDRGSNYPNKSDFSDEGYCLFLNTSNVRKGAFDFSKCDFITRDKDAALRKGKLERGDVILTTRGTVGNSAHYGHEIKFKNARINSGMVILRVDAAKLLPEYLLLILNSDEFTDQVNAMTSGSAQPQLPINRLSLMTLVLPPLSLQKKLVQRVSEIRGFEADQDASRRRLDDLFNSLLHKAFNGEL